MEKERKGQGESNKAETKRINKEVEESERRKKRKRIDKEIEK
jgi:hypothetical protein